MKQIVIKMRTMKKLFNDNLLQLALILSLLKVDPDTYLGYTTAQSGPDPGGERMTTGPTWAQTQPALLDSPRLHPKSLDSLLEIHQAEILEDLNSLGRYSRLSQYGGVPVHISAYILDTERGPASCGERGQDGSDSDSGISDTNHDSDQEITDHEDGEKEKSPEEEELEMECDTDYVNPVDVLGLEAIVGLTPPPDADSEMLAYTTGQDALEAELVHIDSQLMNIEDDLGHIDEAFIMMDQQLAETISDDTIYEEPLQTEDVSLPLQGDSNPFDDWEREALADIDDLVLDPDRLELGGLGTVEPRAVLQEEAAANILQDPDLFPTEQMNGAALLEDFDDDLFGGAAQCKLRPDLERLVRNDVVLPQMPLHTNASRPHRPAGQQPTPDTSLPSREESLYNVTESSRNSGDVVRPSEERDLLQELAVGSDSDTVDRDDEDIIMQVLRESNIDLDQIPIDLEEVVKTETQIKEEDIKEEIIDVEDIGFEVTLVDGAAAKVEIDYDKLHSDLKANFEESEDGSAVAEFTLDPSISLTYSPGFNALAFQNDHSYGAAVKLEPSCMPEASSSRRRNVSESSGYGSMSEEMGPARCRDAAKARKLNLPFSVSEIINSPVDTFNEMLSRPELSAEQIQLCKDIRRRGKNKVAAQNCRKRKMDTIEELQSQVDQVRRRREELLRAREELETERARWSSKLSYLEQSVLAGVGKELGVFTLEVTDSAVVVTSRLTGHALLAGGAEKDPRGGRGRE